MQGDRPGAGAPVLIKSMMGVSSLQLNIPCIKQHYVNDCWICCSVMIYNHFFPYIAMDYSSGHTPQLIQNYLNARRRGRRIGDTPKSAIDFLCWTNDLKVPADQYRLPQFDEIVAEIEQNRPLLCLVKNCTWRGGARDLKCKNGHWIVICGCLETRNTKRLLILDPDPLVSKLVSVEYDGGTYFYRNGMYYQNTSYLDKR